VVGANVANVGILPLFSQVDLNTLAVNVGRKYPDRTSNSPALIVKSVPAVALGAIHRLVGDTNEKVNQWL
jgi:hypothetical protein